MESRTQHAQQLSNMIRFGAVTSVDHAAARCRVLSGELETDLLQWLAPAAGDSVHWNAPAVGEQVLLLCAEGDLGNAVVLRGLYSSAFAAPSNNASVVLQRFSDGAVIQYDSQKHALAAILPSGGTAQVTAPGGLTIDADVTINGSVLVNGNAGVSGTVTAEQDVIGAGKSLKSHGHVGVTAGNAVSGAPA
ncbi:phage baseplate assembly protein V [Xanthomonas sp. 60]